MHLTAATALLAGVVSSGHAMDIDERLSLGGTLAAGGQCQDGSGTFALAEDEVMPFNDTCRGGMPIQFELSFRPSERDELFVAVGYAIDNGLNEVSPFMLAPWAADLEDDVKDINGRNRDALLQAWYKHTFTLGETAELGTTFGIIDSTVYLDENAYANDEYTQFMNEAFVNAGGYSLPSYDAGAAFELAFGSWQIKAVALNIGENDDGHNYNFWGGQIGYQADTGLGEGNYRALITGTSKAFDRPRLEWGMDDETLDALDEVEAPAGAFEKTNLIGYGVSLDQAIGEHLGAFLRLSWSEDKDILEYRAHYTGGLDLGGTLWGRESDNIGLAYGYLEGGDLGLNRTHVAEAYYRLAFNDYLALTADLQYMSDHYDQGDTIEGWIFGMRAVAAF